MRRRCRERAAKTAGDGKQRRLNVYSRMVAHFAYIQDSMDWREWSFRLISERQALLLGLDGEVEAVTRQIYDGFGVPVVDEAGEPVVQVVGYRALKPTSWERPSPATLTFGTLRAVSNAVGLERDLAVTPHERGEVVKFKVWPLIGDTRAVCVRPRISEAERRMAERLAPVSPYAAASRAAYEEMGIAA